MTFSNLTPRLQQVAEAGMEFLTSTYGARGLRKDEEIHNSIPWRPTFHLRPSSALIVAAEVDELIPPTPPRLAAFNLLNYTVPVSVYAICPAEVIPSERLSRLLRELRSYGFGLITVSDDGTAHHHLGCAPIQQHIAEDAFEADIKSLSTPLKRSFRTAYTIYITDPVQGLQRAGQLVESLVNSLVAGGVKAELVPAGVLKDSAADQIDRLYSLKEFKDYRAALGGARDYMREYRNISSHAPRSASEALQRINKCKRGFSEAVKVVGNLAVVAKRLKFRVAIHV